MFVYHTTTRKMLSGPLIYRGLPIIVFLAFSLVFPRQIFPTIYGLVTDQRNGILSLMRLSWSDIAKIPYEYRLEFTDPEMGTTLDMRKAHEYWFFSYLGIDKHFTVSMTKI